MFYLLFPYTRIAARRSLCERLFLSQIALDVQKNLKTTHLIFPNSFCSINCLKKSVPGHVRAQVLQEPNGRSCGDQDGPGCPETPKTTHLIIPNS